jgi:D-alanine--D-alanine ligase
VKVAILTGGPSPERGISLNSARSLADHLDDGVVHVAPVVFFDVRQRPYLISRKMLYSNTPEDFDFKLSTTAEPLSPVRLAGELASADIAFPVMHGKLGEDGQIQQLLEEHGVPYVGSGPRSSAQAYDKWLAHRSLRSRGIETVPSVLCTAEDPGPVGSPDDLAHVAASPTVVVKPAAGGSSLGVEVVEQAEREAAVGRGVQTHGRVVVQPYLQGIELTTVVLEGDDGPVALPPLEVTRPGYRRSPIFSYEDKYLASDDVHYQCPPDRPAEVIALARRCAEQTFGALGLADFARVDCWLLGDRLLVSDVNPISGMEQNSFLFIQAAQAGMTHRDVLRRILLSACRRSGIEPPVRQWQRSADPPAGRRRIAVLFGGTTAERHVSVLSGTNVWLKLLHSERFEPVPYLLEDEGSVWSLTYPAALRHSPEQIAAACRDAPSIEPARQALAADVHRRLGLAPWQASVGSEMPFRLTLEELVDREDFVFVALHGGMGENGSLQALLESRAVAFNGSGSAASRLCADKYETGLRLAGLEDRGIHVAPRVRLDLDDALGRPPADLWRELVSACGTDRVVAKPLDDGCSTGVVPLTDEHELHRYLKALGTGARHLEGATFRELGPAAVVELPTTRVRSILVEAFVETDDVSVDLSSGGPGRLTWGSTRRAGRVEVTVGVLGPEGSLHAFTPSITVARGGVLSVQEKFMGGTGINITPPPGPPTGRTRPGALERARSLIEQAAARLGIRGYARIDAFFDYETGDVTVIEANTLPGLSPSTVLYQQALEEREPLDPRALLERIVDLGIEACRGPDGAGAPPQVTRGTRARISETTS